MQEFNTIRCVRSLPEITGVNVLRRLVLSWIGAHAHLADEQYFDLSSVVDRLVKPGVIGWIQRDRP